MKNKLQENMRRFGTKNLMEQINNDLVDCLKRNGFQKNTHGQLVNTEFNIEWVPFVPSQGKYIVYIYVSIEPKHVQVKVRDLDQSQMEFTMKFKIPQDCDMFVDLLKNRIREKIASNKS